MQIKVEHNPAENNFVCQLGDVHAVLAYSRKANALSLERLFVPEQEDKEKITAALIGATARYCQNHNLQMIPVEAYLRDEFFPTHTEFQSLLKQDPGPGAGAEFLRL